MHQGRPSPSRRAILAVAGLAAARALTGPAAAQEPSAAEGTPFSEGLAEQAARALAARPYQPPQPPLPAAFQGLPYDRYVTIRALPEAMAWGGDGLGFAVEPLHRGYVFEAPVAIHLVEDGKVRRLAYDPSRFDFGKVKPPEGAGDIGFSGFRVHAAYGGAGPVECALFQGASFFKAIARGQGYGITARALSLWQPNDRGEESSAWRAFWIERPEAGSGELVVHAVADSPSASAAMRFAIRPGADATAIEVRGRLFARAALSHVGLGGMTSTYLFGGTGRRFPEDPRPAAYAVGGLRMRNGRGEALYRPVGNPEALGVSLFSDAGPRGFGLLQRDRDYATFQDDVQRWERRPTLWVEPDGDWGEGAVQLVEIPNGSEVNENVLAYWRPKAAVPAGGELGFAYRQSWCWDCPVDEASRGLAQVSNTRVGKAAGSRRRLYLVDFSGDRLRQGPQPEVRLSAGAGKVVRQRAFAYPERGTLRVAFEVEPEGDAAPELRLALQGADGPVSETWLYR